MPTPIPVTVIAGFLGAGKSTLLQNLLDEAHGVRIGVLVNDFGAINIDAATLASAEKGEVVSLENGCVCCTIQEDLLEAVWKLLDLPDPPEYLVIEASGVADPSAIAFTFSVAGVREKAALDAVVTVLDATRPPASQPEEIQALIAQQAGPAHLVLLNKIEAASAEQIKTWQAWLKEEAPRAKAIETSYAQVPAQAVLNLQAEAITPTSPPIKPHVGFSTWSGASEQPAPSLQALHAAMQALPDTVLRVKGWTWLPELGEQPLIIHRVGRRTDFNPGKNWPDKIETRLVVIAQEGQLDATWLDQWFQALLHPNAD